MFYVIIIVSVSVVNRGGIRSGGELVGIRFFVFFVCIFIFEFVRKCGWLLGERYFVDFSVYFGCSIEYSIVS